MDIKERYRVTPGYSFHQLEANRAVLLHETRSISLMGELYVQVLSEIDKNQAGSIENLYQRYSPAEVLYALNRLEGNGIITPLQDNAQKYEWWSSCEQIDAIERIFCDPITIACTSSCYYPIASKALSDAGFTNIQSDTNGKVTLILCNDYLELEVAEVQEKAFEQGTDYCFPVKLSGTILWLGPLMKKGQKPCWHCLVTALQKNRPIENYLSKNGGKTILPEKLTSPVSLQLGINTAIMQLVKKLNCCKSGDSDLITLNMWDLSTEKHRIRTRPQCEVCGNASLFSAQVNSPVELCDIQRHFTDNGGYRTIAPETTWENYKHLVSHLTGIISHIDKYVKKNHQLRPVWKATYFINPHQSVVDKNERFVKNSFGKGSTTEQSRASALCEAIERYSSLYTAEEPEVRNTYNRLKPLAVNPDTLQHFSPRQYEFRKKLNTLELHQKIPLPFDPDKELSWTPLWSLTSNTLRYAPLQYCYSLTPIITEEDMCSCNSNGCAAGNCLEEAILQGFLELVERDATSIWWYNRIPRPGIHLEQFNDTYFNEIKRHYKELGWDLWILDVTHDLQIPTVVALAKNNQNKHFTIGFGCHFTMRLAIQRAITEMHQIFDPAGTHDPVWTEQEIEDPSFLYPDNRFVAPSEKWSSIPERSLKEDILDCAERVIDAGMEFLVLNYTRPDIGVPTVKVVVPGMRHFWKQLGPGRLYTVPVKMGWLDRELTEDAMNTKELSV